MSAGDQQSSSMHTFWQVRFPLFGAAVIAALCVAGLGGLPDPARSLSAWWLAASVEFSLVFAAAVGAELLLGTGIGWLAAYGPVGLHAVLQRASELVGALPLFVYLAVLRLATGGEPFGAFVAVVCVSRVLIAAERTRLLILRLETSTFAAASRALGSSRRHRFAYHMLPHIAEANLDQILQLPAFLVGLEACLRLVGANAGWASWGEALVDDQLPLLSAHRLLALVSLIATGAWAASAAAALSAAAKNRGPRVGVSNALAGS